MLSAGGGEKVGLDSAAVRREPNSNVSILVQLPRENNASVVSPQVVVHQTNFVFLTAYDVRNVVVDEICPVYVLWEGDDVLLDDTVRLVRIWS